jgi:polyisoprenoid-binding protein YceI
MGLKPIQIDQSINSPALVVVLFCGAALASFGSAFAAEQTRAKAPRFEQLALSAQSTVQFRVGVLGVFKKSGRFKRMQGHVQISKRRATVRVVIDVNSAQMAKASDTKLLLSEPYFNAQRFPEILFESRAFHVDQFKNGGQIQGTITVRGVRRPQVLDIEADANCKESNKLLCPFHAKGSLRRSDFGMTARKAFVSDRVDLDLHCIAIAD